MQDVSDWEWWFFKTAQERLQCIKDLRSAPPRKEGIAARWEDWRKQLLDAWAKDHRATMTALLEGGPADPPMADAKEASRVAALEAQLAKYTENRQVAQCVDCGAAIWFREARVEDESGTYHPLCRIMKQKAALEQRIAEAIAILDQVGDNRDAALAKLQGVKA